MKYYIERDEQNKITAKGTTTNEAVINAPLIEVTKEDYETIKQWLPPENIDKVKQCKIISTKVKLEEYLQNYYLTFIDGKHYSITKEKQTLLANALQVYQLKVAAGQTNVTLKWNATGEECVEWTIESLTTLALAIANYVEPLVAKQQALEVQIKNAQTLEELEQIEIKYETV